MARPLICTGILTLAIAIGLTAADGDCSNDMKNLATKCMPYMMYPPNPKIAPSKDCCGAVQNCDMKCVCGHINKEIEKLICMEKVVYIAGECSRPLTKGSKCGSYQIPPI